MMLDDTSLRQLFIDLGMTGLSRLIIWKPDFSSYKLSVPALEPIDQLQQYIHKIKDHVIMRILKIE